MARPVNLWGNPGSKTFAHDYLTTVTFMGHKLTWHKWAVVPLMAVQVDLVAGGWVKKYHWEDVQTYNPRYIAGTTIWSNHAQALAVDINPAKNPYKYGALVTDIPPEVRAIFKKHGFGWGGDYPTHHDAMHFEYMGQPVKGTVPVTPPAPKPVPKETEAAFIDRMWLVPHHSSMTGEQVVSLRDTYGVPVLATLAITGAETSMGDPDLGGATAEAFNYGNMRFTSDRTNKWTWLALPLPVVTSTGKWLAFKSSWDGMTSLGRLLKLGPPGNEGLYLKCLKAGDLTGFYAVYHGATVGGYAANLANLLDIAAKVKAKALAAGWKW